jgi:N6-L-threonylcarbamoyladenine synthase
MLVLGIETTCDETAAAVVERQADGRGRILSNVVLSQIDEHAAFGGVVPEIAARAHVEVLDGIVAEAMQQAGVALNRIDGIAAAAGPGLVGGVIVGLTTAKAIAMVANKPLIAVNHLEAHALTARLTSGVEFPYLLLLVSGGHSELIVCTGVGRHRRLGTSRDDAAGEAFDKTAKLLGLGYPGGPALELAAEGGYPHGFPLPRPLKGRAGCDFSFSGLKTAVRRLLAQAGPLGPPRIADLAASIELAICDALADRTANALAWFRQHHPEGRTLVAAGGVAANRRLRARLADLAETAGLIFLAPPPALCTDNGAMIAWAGLERRRLGLIDGLDAPVRPRWPLDLGNEANRESGGDPSGGR